MRPSGWPTDTCQCILRTMRARREPEKKRVGARGRRQRARARVTEARQNALQRRQLIDVDRRGDNQRGAMRKHCARRIKKNKRQRARARAPQSAAKPKIDKNRFISTMARLLFVSPKTNLNSCSTRRQVHLVLFGVLRQRSKNDNECCLSRCSLPLPRHKSPT